ncbi:hypothetical protein ElyMa_001735500 [Elysia marginata]|uniref:Uncharacterized protein n=1 Tax=Elysia marginata TaxID=1093978 RepID=A0AAV4JX88_9GAST|nr:hypothetical protein ElyMa_001735500 [Elysia marginata]
MTADVPVCLSVRPHMIPELQVYNACLAMPSARLFSSQLLKQGRREGEREGEMRETKSLRALQPPPFFSPNFLTRLFVMWLG